MDPETQIIPVGDLSKICGITPRRCQQLASEGVMKKNDGNRYLIISISGYIDFLKEQINNGSTEDDENSYNYHKTRYQKAKADKEEIAVKLMKGDLYEGDIIRAVMEDLILNARSKALSAPTKYSPKLEGIESLPEIKSLFEDCMFEFLNELSSYDPKKFIDKFIAENISKLETTPEADPEPVGRKKPSTQWGRKR